jgi:polyribonucleotide nucleotidyltransferase
MAITLSRQFGNNTLTFESGKLAMQAGGSCVVTYGETQVLATCTTAQPREGIDFFPLTIDVEERMYAAGKIPGGFFRREGRPSETAILTARLTDRPMRPSFKDGYRDEVQVVITVLSADMANPYDIPGRNAASRATMLRGSVRGRSARSDSARSTASGSSTPRSRRSRRPRSTSLSPADATTRGRSTS